MEPFDNAYYKWMKSHNAFQKVVKKLNPDMNNAYTTDKRLDAMAIDFRSHDGRLEVRRGQRRGQ